MLCLNAWLVFLYQVAPCKGLSLVQCSPLIFIFDFVFHIQAKIDDNFDIVLKLYNPAIFAVGSNVSIHF